MTLQDTLTAFTRHLHRRVMRKHLRWQVRGYANDNLLCALSPCARKGAGIPSLPAPTRLYADPSAHADGVTP